MPIDETRYEYVGFWLRTWAAVVDSVLVMFLLAPVASLIGLDSGGADTDQLRVLMDELQRGSATGADVLVSVAEGMLRGSGGGSLGSNLLLNVVLPAVAVVAFWIARQATPGKMLIRARIVDATTGERPSRAQLFGRYLGYYVSIFGLFLGFAWVALDRRKQGWHDKLAGTVVVRERRGGTLTRPAVDLSRRER